MLAGEESRPFVWANDAASHSHPDARGFSSGVPAPLPTCARKGSERFGTRLASQMNMLPNLPSPVDDNRRCA